MTDHRGYLIGPTLPATQSPWPLGWEQDPTIDDCPHEWELVFLAADGQRRTRIEEVVRCVECHVPRCGHSTDEDPCALRRHHQGKHFLVSQYPPLRPIAEDPVAIRFGWTSWQKAQQGRKTDD